MITEQAKTLEALQIAIQMEIDGKKYYQLMSESKGPEMGIRLFQQLAVEEDYHRQKFEEIYKTFEDKKSWPAVAFETDQGKRLKNIFSEAIDVQRKGKARISQLKAVQKAMEMENKTRDFYKDRAEKAIFEAEKKYYELVAGEESKHHAVLLDYYEYIQNPVDWYTLKEHHSLDGG